MFDYKHKAVSTSGPWMGWACPITGSITEEIFTVQNRPGGFNACPFCKEETEQKVLKDFSVKKEID